MALLSVFTLSMTSCSDDDDPVAKSSIQLKDAEFGHHNEKVATIGKDLHLECEVASTAKIKSIQVSLKKNDKNKIEKTYTDSKYVGVLNTTFHEHLDLPETLEEGEYNCVITVTNVDNVVKTAEAKVKLAKEKADPKAPKISNLKINAMEGAANGKLTFTADIETVDPIDEIEIEFHGAAGEFPQEVDSFKGKNGKVKFEKEITIPAGCKAGEYHIHFTVKDSKGRETTEEIEGFKVK